MAFEAAQETTTTYGFQSANSFNFHHQGSRPTVRNEAIVGDRNRADKPVARDRIYPGRAGRTGRRRPRAWGELGIGRALEGPDAVRLEIMGPRCAVERKEMPELSGHRPPGPVGRRARPGEMMLNVEKPTGRPILTSP